jgi:group II intron reverse transcriptase/maturase
MEHEGRMGQFEDDSGQQYLWPMGPRTHNGSGEGEARPAPCEGPKASSVQAQTDPEMQHLLEQVVQGDNLRQALKRVKANKGSPGVDGRTVEQLPAYLREQWPRLRGELLAGTYRPQPVKRVEIPKPGGGVRLLGVPTALDRFLQQAILQILNPIFDPTFSEHSYGFRPGRSAHQAVKQARQYIQEGYDWVVDLDLEKFFDRVNHDVLMGRLAKRIGDKRLLRLIRRYLEAGVMVHGVVIERAEGTPQGGPLSPLLSNVLLDDLDKELETRGHRFCRYADDSNIYVRSKQAGERVMASVRKFLARRLRLKVNEEKSAVARPSERQFLGFSFNAHTGRINISEKAMRRLRDEIRRRTGRNRGCSLERVIGDLNKLLKGWAGYFHITERPTALEDVDGWIRRRLRCFKMKQWKTKFSTWVRELKRLGLPEWQAQKLGGSRRGWWALSASPQAQQAFSPAYFQGKGLTILLDRCLALKAP